MSDPTAPAVHVPPPRQTLSLMLCNYNHAQFVGQAIEAVLAQTRRPDELLIMDDGSTDASFEIIRRYAEKHDFIRAFRKEKNEGHIRGSIELTARARGDFLHRTASDDEMHDNFVATLMDHADRHPDVGIVSGALLVTSEDDPSRYLLGIPGWSSGRHSGSDYRRDLLEVDAPRRGLAPSTIFRRTAVEALGGWRADLGIWEVTFIQHAAALAFDMCYAEEPIHTWVYRAKGWSYQSALDVGASMDVYARYYAAMRSGRFRSLFGDIYPRRCLVAVTEQCLDQTFEVMTTAAIALRGSPAAPPGP